MVILVVTSTSRQATIDCGTTKEKKGRRKGSYSRFTVAEKLGYNHMIKLCCDGLNYNQIIEIVQLYILCSY